mgnify:CR=1 FL=1
MNRRSDIMSAMGYKAVFPLADWQRTISSFRAVSIAASAEECPPLKQTIFFSGFLAPAGMVNPSGCSLLYPIVPQRAPWCQTRKEIIMAAPHIPEGFI